MANLQEVGGHAGIKAGEAVHFVDVDRRLGDAREACEGRGTWD